MSASGESQHPKQTAVTFPYFSVEPNVLRSPTFMLTKPLFYLSLPCSRSGPSRTLCDLYSLLACQQLRTISTTSCGPTHLAGGKTISFRARNLRIYVTLANPPECAICSGYAMTLACHLYMTYQAPIRPMHYLSSSLPLSTHVRPRPSFELRTSEPGELQRLIFRWIDSFRNPNRNTRDTSSFGYKSDPLFP